MKKYLLLITLAVVVAPLLIAGCAAPSGPSPSPSTATSKVSTHAATAKASTSAIAPVTSSAATTSATAGAGAGSYTVAIPDFSFSPSTLTIPVGSSVTWRNDASVPHQIVSNTGAFTSSILNTGNTYTHQFSQAGTYPYHCGIHPYMTGTITVR